MRLTAILLALLLALTVYLNRSYAAFYDLIGQKHLGSPYTRNTFLIESLPTDFKNDKLTTVKYVALGDSLTAGVGSTNYKETYPYIAAKKLLSKSYEVTFENLGKPGAESSDVLNSQIPKAVLENPDYVSILVGINDIHNLKSITEYKRNMSQILETLKTKTHAKITVIDIPLLGYENWQFPYRDLLDLRTRQFNDALKNLPEIKNVNFIDLYTRSREQFLLDKNLYSSDLFHPNNQGYIFWGNLINVN